MNIHNPALLFAVILGGLALLAITLIPGIHGALYYDDVTILAVVPEFHSGHLSLAQFLQAGFDAGSLGRPISMLSFLWPVETNLDHVQAFFLINIALHVANTILVGLLAWRIGKLLNSPHALWLGIFCAALWGLAPIQAASVLIAVQRMAELSAFFIFLGLLLWVIGLQHAMLRPRQGRFLQVTGLVGMTLLAMLSKENGVLLPIFAGVIEATLLARLALPERKVRNVLYLASTAVVIGYLAFYTWHYEGVYWERNFDIWERLITEAGILFEYLRQSIAPRFLDIHPFHDAHPIVRSLTESPLHILAVIFWPLATLLAWLWRKRWPVLAFALLWFVVAHLLESSVIGLELYFDHRQYLAWFGPAFAIAWGVLHVPVRYQTIARIGLVVYVLFLGLMMRQTAELWGHPDTSARIWFDRSPGSARAAEFLVKEYLARNQSDQALLVIEKQIQNCPDCLSSIAQAVQISCVLGDKPILERNLAAFFERAPHVAQTFSTGTTLLSIHDHIQKGQCKLIDFATLQKMNEALLARSQYMYDTKRQELLLNLYRIAVEQGNLFKAASIMPEMYTAFPRPELGPQIVRNMLELGLTHEAESFTKEHICSPHQEGGFWLHDEWKNACVQANTMLEQK